MLPLHLTLTLPSSPFVDALFSIVDDVSLNLMMLILSFFSFDFIRDCRYFSQLFMSAMKNLEDPCLLKQLVLHSSNPYNACSGRCKSYSASMKELFLKVRGFLVLRGGDILTIPPVSTTIPVSDVMMKEFLKYECQTETHPCFLDAIILYIQDDIDASSLQQLVSNSNGKEEGNLYDYQPALDLTALLRSLDIPTTSWRGYATEKQKGLLLIVEKLDYLQSKLLRRTFFSISKPLTKLGTWMSEIWSGAAVELFGVRKGSKRREGKGRECEEG
ncbi:hypothetical protein JHK82_040971 [Glycine max]|nr:hypothetical protein JHK85_041651 [Glycine max]KAG5104001.1 hypothetical protein JHK82_040971 [Glycine max]KAG5115128.1 hypothetical protein JHK84_041241 [Glycine max]